MEYTIIFDNGGGVTLQLGDWAHWYPQRFVAQAAEDLHVYLETGNTDGWDGHEPEAAELDPSYEEIRNGGYRVYTDIDDLLESVEDSGWGNIEDFAKAWLTPLIGQIVHPTGYYGQWIVIERDCRPNNHNILVRHIETGKEMWISYDAL